MLGRLRAPSRRRSVIEEAEALGVPERILDGAPAHAGPRGEFVNGPIASAAVSVLIGHDAQHRDLGQHECCGELH